MSDFNSDPFKAGHHKFFTELEQLCIERDLIFADISRLPGDSDTHINNGSLSKSWLDHCIISPILKDIMCNIFIDNEYSGSDNFPLHAHFNLSMNSRRYRTIIPEKEQIDWKFQDSQKSILFYNLVYQHCIIKLT